MTKFGRTLDDAGWDLATLLERVGAETGSLLWSPSASVPDISIVMELDKYIPNDEFPIFQMFPEIDPQDLIGVPAQAGKPRDPQKTFGQYITIHKDAGYTITEIVEQIVSFALSVKKINNPFINRHIAKKVIESSNKTFEPMKGGHFVITGNVPGYTKGEVGDILKYVFAQSPTAKVRDPDLAFYGYADRSTAKYSTLSSVDKTPWAPGAMTVTSPVGIQNDILAKLVTDYKKWKDIE